MKTVLLNYLCRGFIGHAIEAMRYTRGLTEANPGMEIHLALSDRGQPDIFTRYPWVTRVHPIHLADLEGPEPDPAALAGLPTEWDYIIDDLMMLHNTDGVDPARLNAEAIALRRWYGLTAELLTARGGRGELHPAMRLPDGLAYRPGTHVTLSVPDENRAFADRYAHTGHKICVMLGGSSSYQWYPDVSSWIKILRAVSEALPGTRFYLTGLRQSQGGGTRTQGYNNQDIADVLASGPDIVDCYDIGFWNQIALQESCDLIIAPRTGFAAISVCVGTPWLTVAGGDWSEYFFNGVPFYIVLPNDPDYPYEAEVYPQVTTVKIPAMRPENFDPTIPEFVEGARLLLDPEFTYEAAIERYRQNIAKADVRRHLVLLPDDPMLADF